MITTVTKEFIFDSAHFIENYVGPCANIHGHTYKLQVTLEGRVNPATGMIIDFSRLKQEVNSRIIDLLDHKMLNDVLNFNPTAELMAQWMFDQLRMADLPVVKIKLWETPTSFATVKEELIYE